MLVIPGTIFRSLDRVVFLFTDLGYVLVVGLLNPALNQSLIPYGP